MAATAKTRTWTCPNRGVFYSWTVLLLVLVVAVEVGVAAPETGLWKITVVNVSFTRINGKESWWVTVAVTLLAELALLLSAVDVVAV